MTRTTARYLDGRTIEICTITPPAIRATLVDVGRCFRLTLRDEHGETNDEIAPAHGWDHVVRCLRARIARASRADDVSFTAHYTGAF